MRNLKTKALILLVVSIPTTIVGYFLQTILIPIQDFHILSQEEVLQTQKDIAINYPLGRFLLYGGLLVFCVCSILLLILFVKSVIRDIKSSRS